MQISLVPSSTGWPAWSWGPSVLIFWTSYVSGWPAWSWGPFSVLITVVEGWPAWSWGPFSVLIAVVESQIVLFKADYWRLSVLGNICWQPLFDCGLVSDLWSLVSSGSPSALLGALRILPWGQFCLLSSVGWPAWSWGPSVLIIWASKSSSSFWLCLASFGWETFVGDAASDSWSLVCVDLSSRSLTVWFFVLAALYSPGS